MARTLRRFPGLGSVRPGAERMAADCTYSKKACFLIVT
jgi:hypothetical protein